MIFIETSRLLLRDWRESDIEPFARMNADLNVMEYLLKPLSAQESYAYCRRIVAEFDMRGYGLYALERREDGRFLGYTGFHGFDMATDFSPGTEIGWRLAHEFWGQGYAPEAAAACLEYASSCLQLNEVFSFTYIGNNRSERVMQKIGMEKLGSFQHPGVPDSHPLKEHVLYRVVL